MTRLHCAFPKIRFKGFSENWIKEKLTNILLFSKGKQKNKELLNKEGLFPVINGGVMPSGYTDKYNKLENTIVVSEGGNSCGYIQLIKSKFWCGGHCYSIDRTKLNYLFLYQLLKNKEIEIMNLRIGSGLPNIQRKSLENFQVLYSCNIEEQTQIGNFFQKLDEVIELQQKRLEQVQTYKKAMLQKMFPQQGKTLSKICFKGFSGDWKSVPFSSIFEYERPDNYLVSNTEYLNKGIAVLTANKSFILGYTNETNIYNKGPCILLDDFTLDSKYVTFPYMLKSTAIKILTTKENYNLKFSFERLNTQSIIHNGHARHYISIVQPLKTEVPLLKEQTQIGNFFQKLDDLVEQYKIRLENYKSLKKAMLQRLFV